MVDLRECRLCGAHCNVEILEGEDWGEAKLYICSKSTLYGFGCQSPAYFLPDAWNTCPEPPKPETPKPIVAGVDEDFPAPDANFWPAVSEDVVVRVALVLANLDASQVPDLPFVESIDDFRFDRDRDGYLANARTVIAAMRPDPLLDEVREGLRSMIRMFGEPINSESRALLGKLGEGK